jgi:hypothetical protein
MALGRFTFPSETRLSRVLAREIVGSQLQPRSFPGKIAAGQSMRGMP